MFINFSSGFSKSATLIILAIVFGFAFGIFVKHSARTVDTAATVLHHEQTQETDYRCGWGYDALDDDRDGVCNYLDVCNGGPDWEDTDNDGVCDYLDHCPFDFDPYNLEETCD